MDFKDLMAVTGKSGLYQLIKARQDGVIVRALGEEKNSFISSRKHSFTPLENIGVYLQSGDTVELKEVMRGIAAQGEAPQAQASADELRDFFRVVLPDHDEDKVRVSDMKKIMQWNEQLTSIGWFDGQDEEE